jgi:ligand-binding SRPBCC domain-containing protein
MDNKLRNYRHRFRVRASADQVAEFHTRAASMAAITPPPVLVKIHQAPAALREGDKMDFTMWLGPLPVYWKAQIEGSSAKGFTDRQLRGPFAEWAHRHTFVPIDEKTTDVVDEVQLKLRRHPFWWMVGLLMRVGLPFLFAFRAWKTKRILE